MKKTLVFLGTQAALLMGAANSVFAVSILCPDDAQLGTGFNALCTTSSSGSIEGLISTVINVVLFVAFVAALVYLIIGGIRWIMSGGDKEGTAKAKAGVTSALIGLAIVLASYLLMNVVLGFFNITGGVGGLKAPTIQFGRTGGADTPSRR